MLLEKLREDKRLWDLFTRREEYNPRFTDRYRRFNYFLSGNRNIFEPEVSQYLIDRGLKIEYPEARKFAVCLTHDVDNVFFTRRGLVIQWVDALRGKNIAGAFKILLYNRSRNLNPLRNFKDIIRLEKKYNAESSFYFLALEKGEDDFNFRIENLKTDLQNIVNSGYEVGLHGGHNAYNDMNVILEQKKRVEEVLGGKITGYRNHYLRFEVPTTWEFLRKAGFKYDTTFGYADCVGFRNGLCHPFKPYNLKTEEFIDVIEIPLVIMDRTLDSYMKLNIMDSLTLVKSLIDTVERLNGAVAILWHNTDMTGERLRLYEQILSYCSNKGAWLTSARALYEWWTQKNPMI